jgi:hypothetical protein
VATLTQAIEKTAATLGISIGAAKIKIIEACHAGLIRTCWYGYHLGGSPPITRHEWADADLIIDTNFNDAVLVPANGGQRKRGISLDPSDFEAWLIAPTGSNRQPARQGGKSVRVERAAHAIWGDAGPPAHLEPKVICREIRDRLKANEGSDPKMDNKTIIRAIRKKA